MNKITVELDAEVVDQIIVDQLFETRSVLLRDYERGNAKVFSLDPEEDRVEIRKMIESLERVISPCTCNGCACNYWITSR